MNTDLIETPDENIIVESVSTTIRRSYMDYALQVIRHRAVPDIRDGLKPVHRRILYAMFESGFTSDKPYRKSARAVGDIMGKYHPHGDSSIYEALVALGQHWTTNGMLIDPQGNFGNIDGDGAAAMRYTEARLSQMAMTFFTDIKQDTVAWQSNYDETEEEPTVLPVPYPNLLVNGTSGIAVGIATEIMPHNLVEVINATKLLMADPETPTEKLLEVLKGPDFPTKGIVHGLDGFVSALELGSGRIFNRAQYTIESRGGRAEQIVITEIPFKVKKSNILLQIKDLVAQKEIDGITDLNDESNKNGMRIVIAVRRDESAEAIIAQLFKKTSLEISETYNCTVIENNEPVKKGLRYMILSWIAFRREVVHARTVFLRKKAENELHIFEGYKKALDHLDAVITLIRKAPTTADAKTGLMALLDATEIQADRIINLRLGRLTGMELQKIVDELHALQKYIADLTDIIQSPARIDEQIVQELTIISESFGRPRQTEIAHGLSTITHEDMIPRENVVIMMTEAGYIKRLPTSSISTQGRNTRGKSGITVGEGDRITFLRECHSHDLIMVVTASGQTLGIKAFEIPETPATSRGRHIKNIIEGIDEEILTIMAVPDLSEEERQHVDPDRGPLHTLVSISKKGIIRRTPISDFDGITRKNGIKGLKFFDGDSYAACFVMHRDDDLILTSSNGKTIRIAIASVNTQSRLGTGVAGIKVDDGDAVIGASVIPGGQNDGHSIIIVSENGVGKRTPVSEFENQGRGGKGVYLLRPNKKKIGALLKSSVANNECDIIFITQNGINNRISIDSLHEVSREASGGVSMINLDDGDKLVDFTIVSPENETDEISNDEG